MKRTWLLALAASATLLSAGAAHANGVHWSIGINLPALPLLPPLPPLPLVSRAPFYVQAPAPVYYDEAPVRYAPPVVYEQPVYQEPVYQAPRIVYREPHRDFDGRRFIDYRGDRDRYEDHDRGGRWASGHVPHDDRGSERGHDREVRR